MSKRKRLTLSLPVTAWDRLSQEAERAGVRIGTYVTRLLTDTDTRWTDTDTEYEEDRA